MTNYTPTPDALPYNAAYLVDDRSHLYHEFEVDRALDDGIERDGQTEAPPDYQARRHAILSFYGHRCGRCAKRLARGDPADDESLGHVHSVATEGPRWRLAALVAVCAPCFDLLTAESPAALTEFDRAHADAPQFPQWCCDPRVAVERAPLSGREVWLRERLAERVDAEATGDAPNAPVAGRCCLALDTPAAVAVALGDALAADHATHPADGSLLDRWAGLPDGDRAWYDTQAVDVEVLAEDADEAVVAFGTLADATATAFGPLRSDGGEPEPR